VAEARREKDLVPCRTACPVQIDVPAYLRLIAMGKADEANAVIREKVPFPGVLGRVCIHPCEEACRRGEINQPISICALKRYAVDNEKGLWRIENKVAADSGKKAAVVGAGPPMNHLTGSLEPVGASLTSSGRFPARTVKSGIWRYPPT